jgi:hypothetical protein
MQSEHKTSLQFDGIILLTDDSRVSYLQRPSEIHLQESSELLCRNIFTETSQNQHTGGTFLTFSV